MLLASDVGSMITGQAYNVDGGAVVVPGDPQNLVGKLGFTRPAPPARTKLTDSNTII